MRRREFIAMLGAAASTAWPLSARTQQPERVRRIGRLGTSEGSQVVAVPMMVEGNVSIVELEFQASSGAARQARFMVDTGGGTFIIGSKLMRDTGANPTGPELKSQGMQMVPVQSLPTKLGGLDLDLSEVRMLALPENKWVGG